MDNQRLITWGLFGLLLYFTWQTWMQDYGSAPQPVAADQAQEPIQLDTDAGLPKHSRNA